MSIKISLKIRGVLYVLLFSRVLIRVSLIQKTFIRDVRVVDIEYVPASALLQLANAASVEFKNLNISRSNTPDKHEDQDEKEVWTPPYVLAFRKIKNDRHKKGKNGQNRANMGKI